MQEIKGSRIDKNTWVRPWNIEKFDDLSNRDERFFSILLKGALGYLQSNIVLYNKEIRHYIFNTGSSYMYIEDNGYEYNMSETTGEDGMYNHMPRCVATLGDISIDNTELSQPHARGTYERREDNQIKTFNAEMRRMPIQVSLNCTYVTQTTNEMLILIQELIDKLAFQQYFRITYLGQVIECAIQTQESFQAQFNQIDMTSPDVNQKTLTLSFTINSSYPVINVRSEIPANKIIRTFNATIETYKDPDIQNSLDIHNYITPKD